MQIKKCYLCKQELPLNKENFAKHSQRKDGFQSQCRKCQKEYRKNHYNKNQQKYIKKAKRIREKLKIEFINWLKDKKCVDCGNSDIRVLEFDHIKGKKGYNVSRKIGECKLEVLLQEIEKCDIVCANCHRIRTCERGQFAKSRINV